MAEPTPEKTPSKIEKNLERLYKTALEQENELDFFKGINAYINYVVETPILKAVVDEQMAERAGRYEKVEQAEKMAVEEMLASKDRLLAIIKKHKIDTSNFVRNSTFAHEPYTDIVVELGAFERGEIIKGHFHSDSYESYLYDIASNLQKMGYGKELGNMAVTKEQYRDYYARINGTSGYWFAGNENGIFIFSQSWAERFEQEALLKRERTLKQWGAFEKIVQLKCAYDAVMENVSFWKITEMNSQYRNLFKVEDVIDIGYMAEDLQYLMGQTRDDSPRKYRASHLTSSPLDRLNVVAFKSITQTVHNLLMQTVEFDTVEERAKPVFEKFDAKKGILKFAGQEIELAKKGRETDAVLLMKTILKAKNNDWKHNDEILSDWGYNDEDQKSISKNKVYFAGRQINNAIARKTQISDFVDCNTSKARINPKYKKVDG